MDADTIIAIIFIFIFFILPLIGRILEAVGGQPAPKSPQELKEQLKKIRGQQQQHRPQTQYRPPATRPGGAAPVSQTTPSSVVIQQKIVEAVAQHLAPEDPGKKAAGKKAAFPKRAEALRKLVLDNTQYSDIQKAIILQEIFNKPKILQGIFRQAPFLPVGNQPVMDGRQSQK